MFHSQEKTAHIYGNMIHVFEMLLCYWAWLKKAEYWQSDDYKSLQIAKKQYGFSPAN